MLWYMATPYTKYPAGIAAAYKDALRNLADLTAAGVSAFSPIVHSHPQCTVHDLENTLEFWHRVNVSFLTQCHGMLAVDMPGWTDSAGVKAEAAFMREWSRPVVRIGHRPVDAPTGGRSDMIRLSIMKGLFVFDAEVGSKRHGTHLDAHLEFDKHRRALSPEAVATWKEWSAAKKGGEASPMEAA
jgi:hypothetical protein